MRLWDFDLVEEKNLLTCPYGPEDVGRPKVDALLSIIGMGEGYGHRFEESEEHEFIDLDILVLTTDTALSRMDALRTVRFAEAHIPLIVSVGTLGEAMRIIAFEEGEEGEYFIPEFDRPPDSIPACGREAQAYLGFSAAGITVGVIKAYLMRGTYPKMLYLDHGTMSWVKG